MSLIQWLEKARDHYDEIARVSAVQRRYDHEAAELRDLLDDSIKALKQELPMCIGNDGVSHLVVVQ